MSGPTPCPSVVRAVLGVVDPGGTLLRCGLLADHDGDHEFKVSWRDPEPTGINEQIRLMLDSRHEDPEFRERIRLRMEQDAEILRRLAEQESACCCELTTARLVVCPVHGSTA